MRGGQWSCVVSVEGGSARRGNSSSGMSTKFEQRKRGRAGRLAGWARQYGPRWWAATLVNYCCFCQLSELV